MNPEQQRVAIAEACGWTDVRFIGRGDDTICVGKPKVRPGGINVPDYCNDLNAMQSSVQSQSERFQDDFDSALKNSGKWVASMTAQEWADIFILCLQSQRDSGNSTP